MPTRPTTMRVALFFIIAGFEPWQRGCQAHIFHYFSPSCGFARDLSRFNERASHRLRSDDAADGRCDLSGQLKREPSNYVGWSEICPTLGLPNFQIAAGLEAPKPRHRDSEYAISSESHCLLGGRLFFRNVRNFRAQFP